MWKTSSRCGRVERDGGSHDALRERSPRRQGKYAERSFSGPVISTSCLSEGIQEKGLTSKLAGEAHEDSKSNKSNGTTSHSIGAKLLKALRRKVLSSSNSGNRRLPANNSQVHDDGLKQNERRNSVSQEDEVYLGSHDYEQLSVQQLQEELQKLRRILDSDRAEMSKLRNEVSWLRLARASGGFSPVSEHNLHAPPLVDGSSFVCRTDSVRSDVSCLDFSLASTGMLKFEGETKTKVSPTSDTQQETEEQLDPFPSDETLQGQGKSEDSDNLNSFGEKKVKSVSGRGPTRNEAQGHQEPEFVKHCHSQSGADLKLVNKFKKTKELQIIPPTFSDEPEEFGCPSSEGRSARYSSRSPPKSVSSTDESEPVLFPVKKSDSDTDSEKSFVLHKADLLKVAGGQSMETRADCTSSVNDSEAVFKQSQLETRRHDLEESLRVGVCNPINECESEASENDKTSDGALSKRNFDSSLFTSSANLMTESFALSEIVSDSKHIPQSEFGRAVVNASQQDTEMPRSQSRHSKFSSLIPSVPENKSSRARTNPRGAHNTLGGSSQEFGSQTSGETDFRGSRLSRSKSQGTSSSREALEPFKIPNGSYAAGDGESVNRPATRYSRRASVDGGAVSSTRNSREMLYPELELEKLTKTLKSLGHDRSSSSLHTSQPASRSPSYSRFSTSAMTEQPRRSLDSQVKAFSYSDPSRAVIGAWYDYNEKQSRSPVLSAPSISFYSDNSRHLDRSFNGGWTNSHELADNLDSTAGVPRQGYSLRTSSSPTARSPSHSPLRSPSRYGSESQLHEVVSGAILKSGSGVSIAEMLTYDKSATRSADKLYLDEGNRRYVEQSRPDVTARNSDEIDSGGARSPRRQGDEPFSVLALSRRRRSMEKERTFSQDNDFLQRGQASSPMQKDDRTSPRSLAVSDGVEAGVKTSASRRRSHDGTGGNAGKLAGFFESESRSGGDVGHPQATAVDDRSSITLRLREAVDIWDKRETADSQSDEHSIWDISTAPSRSRSRSRSRFYAEATSPVYSGVGSRGSGIYSLS